MDDWDNYLDVDKIFFAKSLVKFVFRDNDNVYTDPILEDNVGELHNTFTYWVRIAVESIEVSHSYSVESLFRKMEDEDGLNEDAFIDYGLYLRRRSFPQVFNVEIFLWYSVFIAMLASKFPAPEISNVAVLAVCLIIACFSDYDMVLSGGWETLQEVAKKYARNSD